MEVRAGSVYTGGQSLAVSLYHQDIPSSPVYQKGTTLLPWVGVCLGSAAAQIIASGKSRSKGRLAQWGCCDPPSGAALGGPQ